MVRVGGYAVMLLGPRGARASLFCLAALGVITLSVLSAALAAHLKGTLLTGADPRLVRAALNPNVDPGTTDSQPLPPLDANSVVNTLTVAKGDTLKGLLVAAGSDGRAADAVIRALSKSFDPRKLRVGQELTIVLNPPGKPETKPNLSAVSLELGDNAYIVVRRDGEGFLASRTEAPILPSSTGTSIAAGPRTIFTVRKNDTLNKMLRRAGATPEDAEAAAVAIGRHYDPHQLRVGQELTTIFEPQDGADQGRLATASLSREDGSYAVASRSFDGAFRSNTAREPLTPLLVPPSTEATVEPPAATGNVDAKPAAAPREEPREKPAAPEEPMQQAAVAPDEPQEGPAAPEEQAEEQIERAAAPRDEPIEQTAPHDEEPRQVAMAVNRRIEDTIARPPAADSATLTTIHVRKGDTLTRVLLRAGSGRSDAHAAITALSDHYDPRRLQPGQELVVAFAGEDRSASPILAAVSVNLGDNSYVVAGRDREGRFAAGRASEPLSVTMDAALFASAIAPPEIVFAPEPGDVSRKRLRLESGDTLMDTLLRAGIGRQDAHAAIAALRKRTDPRRLKAGQQLTLVLAPDRGDGPMLHSLSLASEPGRSVEASRSETGGFAVRDVVVPLDRVLVHAGGRIDSSLYRSASKAGVPLTVMMEMIRAFSFDVDFQRDIQNGDSFAMLFERYTDESGEVVREGNLLHAAITLRTQTLKVYRYPLDDDYFDYFSDDGQSVRKALLRTPINGARLSSGYGKRKHPILGYTKMHRGLDFAAPSGTPIVAAGDGVIERIGRNGAYGRYIRIRHKGQYSTAYAHMKGFARGLKRGRRVRQGDVIGYVGSTGRSTGPHLHYEVLAGGRQINPLKIKLPTGPKLKGDELAAFRRARNEIERQLAALPLVRHVANRGLSSLACGGASQETTIAIRGESGRQLEQC